MLEFIHAHSQTLLFGITFMAIVLFVIERMETEVLDREETAHQ